MMKTSKVRDFPAEYAAAKKVLDEAVTSTDEFYAKQELTFIVRAARFAGIELEK